METRREWTKPYFGVQHLDGLRRGWQITVTDRESFAECWVRPEGAGFNGHTTQHDSADLARQYGEQQAHVMDAYASRPTPTATKAAAPEAT